MRYALTAALLAGLLLGCNNGNGVQTTEIDDPPQRSLDQLSPSESNGQASEQSPQRQRREYSWDEPDDTPSAATEEARPPEEPLPPEVVPGSTTYVVKSGDTLWSISERLLGDGQRWREIVEMNPGLDPEDMRIGQELRIPAE
ncbi:MAG: LysM peptidoglycan-binding domain-containing protein [Planctomycetota bacterium]